MTVSAEVQAQIDKTRELNDLVQSVHSAMQALTLQLQDIQAKAQAIPTTAQGSPAQGGMSEEDKAALVQTVQDTQSVINQLKSDITANTPQDVSAQPAAQPATTPDQPAPATPADGAAPATQAAAPPPQPTNPNA